MISFHTFGTVDLRKGDISLSTILAQPKRVALLAYLAAARPRGFHDRDRLVALFWPDAEGERARTSLRQALHQLRRALGEDAVPDRGDQEVGVNHALIRTDAVDFADAVEAGRWEDALAIYRGDFLAGVVVEEAPEVQRWIDGERAFRRRQAVEAAWKLVELAERSGDATAAGKWRSHAAELDPTGERPPASAPEFVRAGTRTAPSAEPVPMPLPIGVPAPGPTGSDRTHHLALWLVAIAVVAVLVGFCGVWGERSRTAELPDPVRTDRAVTGEVGGERAGEYLS